MNNKGMSLTGVLVLTAIISVIALAVGSLALQIARTQQQAFTVYNLDSARRNLSTYLASAPAWAATVAALPDLACLNRAVAGGECVNGDRPLKVYGPGGQLIFDPATQGFDRGGNICTVSAPNPSACPIRLPLVAEVHCLPRADGSIPPRCTDLQELRLRGGFDVTRMSETIAFNPNNYAINIVAFAGAAAAAGPATSCERIFQLTERTFRAMSTGLPPIATLEAQCKTEFGSNWFLAMPPDIQMAGAGCSGFAWGNPCGYLHKGVTSAGLETQMMPNSGFLNGAFYPAGCTCKTLRTP